MTDTVVLFAGHRVDEPNRVSPRFPQQCESQARLAIGSAMKRLASSGTVLGIGGAADGGDILFHEACAELGIQSEVCLALPAAEYVRTSVRASWTYRFWRLLTTHPVAILEPGSGDLWFRDHEWQLRRARELQPRRTVLVALLEEADHDVPGGTSGMVRLALESGVEVIRLNLQHICAPR